MRPPDWPVLEAELEVMFVAEYWLLSIDWFWCNIWCWETFGVVRPKFCWFSELVSGL